MVICEFSDTCPRTAEECRHKTEHPPVLLFAAIQCWHPHPCQAGDECRVSHCKEVEPPVVEWPELKL
jgi:hypothetical protein